MTQKLRFNSAEATFVEGQVRQSLSAAGEGGLSAEDGIECGDLDKSAHFTEMLVGRRLSPFPALPGILQTGSVLVQIRDPA